jgi:glucans biosynthesis protein
MRSVTRRWAVSALALSCGAAGAVQAWAAGADWPTQAPLGPPAPFSFERLKADARRLAAEPYRPPHSPPSEQMRLIDYDVWSAATYRASDALWSNAPGGQEVRFFPIGPAAPRPVAMHVVAGGTARQVLYSPALFDMAANSPLRKLGDDPGFGGFRVMNPDNAGDWLAFLGASYFRSADPFNQYGLSARGVAIDTATPAAEEFPDFTSFWIERAPGGLVVYALLDGPSVTGAYRIVHHRSSAGLVQDIDLQLNFRRRVTRLGLAPLTSMYWYGESDRRPGGDWRPQVHDSDGLAIWTGAGERIWRPLANPTRVSSNAYLDRSPRGFGLLQRDRAFADYQDDDIFYERRPSAWVEPIGDWGPGSVQLVEIPTLGETQDNIVAFWTPARTPGAGASLPLRYRLHWKAEEPAPPGVARVIATRFGHGGRPGEAVPPNRRRFVVDFRGDNLAGLTRRGDAEPVVTATGGRVIEPAAYPVVGQSMWRLLFDVDVPPAGTADLRAYLKRGNAALTETWMYAA